MPAALTLAIMVLASSSCAAPRPLLPRLAEAFAVSESQTALLMTATLLPLGIAPIAYGAVLARATSRQVLLIGVGALGLVTLLLGLRLAQGLVLPAVLTAMMTALSERTRGLGVSHRPGLLRIALRDRRMEHHDCPAGRRGPGGAGLHCPTPPAPPRA